MNPIPTQTASTRSSLAASLRILGWLLILGYPFLALATTRVLLVFSDVTLIGILFLVVARILHNQERILQKDKTLDTKESAGVKLP